MKSMIKPGDAKQMGGSTNIYVASRRAGRFAKTWMAVESAPPGKQLVESKELSKTDRITCDCQLRIQIWLH